MSVIRSPPQASNTYADSDKNLITIATSLDRTGGSQPDLRKLAEYGQDLESQHKSTFRHKRKYPDDDLAAKFETLQSNIKSMLMDMAKVQSENLNKISSDVSLIKEQITRIKDTTDHLSLEQEKLKLDLVNISNFKIKVEEKVDSLETAVKSINTTIAILQIQQQYTYENFINESQARLQREKNIIIRGINEIHSTDPEVRRKYDMEEVNKVIKTAVPDCVAPLKTIRLGKYEPRKSRLIKVIF